MVSLVKNINSDWVIIQNKRAESGLVPFNYISKYNGNDANTNSVSDSATSSPYRDPKVIKKVDKVLRMTLPK